MATRPSWKTLLEQPFVKAVRDPTLIKGIYNTCDQWCMYCPATARCLAYRCRPAGVTDGGAKNIYDNIADRMIEGMAMLRAVNAAEGRSIPELEALLANDPRRGIELARIDDPLERLGRRYAVTASRYLASHPSFRFDMTRRSGGPTPSRCSPGTRG